MTDLENKLHTFLLLELHNQEMIRSTLEILSVAIKYNFQLVGQTLEILKMFIDDKGLEKKYISMPPNDQLLFDFLEECGNLGFSQLQSLFSKFQREVRSSEINSLTFANLYSALSNFRKEQRRARKTADEVSTQVARF